MGKTMVFYRAEEYRKMELERSIVVEHSILEETLKKLCSQNVDALADPGEFYEELAKVGVILLFDFC